MPKYQSQNIVIKGARVHNLKNISLKIPKNKLVVITGVSGSGKSSLAFDTLYAEGQRRYIESFSSSYAQQFLGVIDKPDVDKIEGLPPAISIQAQSIIKNPRSTVGTMTEIYDLLRLLFSRIGRPFCPKCGKPIYRSTIGQIEKEILGLPRGSQIFVLAPTKKSLKKLKEQGFIRVRIDGKIYNIGEVRPPEEVEPPKIEVVIDSFTINKKDLDRVRIVDSIETGLKTGNGVVVFRVCHGKNCEDLVFSNKFICQKCGVRFPELEPRLFSFNSPFGACPACTGLGVKLEVDPKLVIPNRRLSLAEGAIRPAFRWQALEKLARKYKFSLNTPVKNLSEKVINLILYGEEDYQGVIPELEQRYQEAVSEFSRSEIEKYMLIKTCPVCQGKRLRLEALAIKIAGKSIDEIVNMNIESCKEFFEKTCRNASVLGKKEIEIAKPIIQEIVRQLQLLIDVNLEYLNLARDAPSLSVGEFQRIKLANQISSKLSGVLYVLDEPSVGLHPRDQERLIKALKNLRDIGNTVLVVEHDEQTIESADWVIDIGPGAGKKGGKVIFQGTPQKEHNLKNIDIKIPLSAFVCITGVSGSGKSTLMNDILAKALAKRFYRAHAEPGAHKEIRGLENLNKVVIVDQSPIGRTPRSNPATYSGVFSYIRNLFAKVKQAKARGYKAGHFSFNVKGGRCEECQGAGVKKIEMYYLPDRYIKCSECRGRRYNSDILEIRYRGVNISEILEMTIEEASQFFKDISVLKEKLSVLKEVGLGYVKMGQPAPSLSGGEAQRVKLATELSRKSFGKTIYILDEPTTGLHPLDIKNLLKVLKKLVDKGNTVLVIEHNLDIIKNADWVIDLGPEGGDQGGYLVAEGIPKEITKVKKSYTGQWLKKICIGY